VGENSMNNDTLTLLDEEMMREIITSKVNNKGEDEIAFYDDYIKGKTIEEIQEKLKNCIASEKVAELLLTETTSDDGGVVALSGFYFQFLVSIEYLVELIEGKWDYLLIDHHQDIIVFNHEKIRIIQAKTKDVNYCEVSKTKLYTEWIQKLFVLDELFINYPQKTEFELVTNFIIQNAPKVPVEIYHNNNEFDMKIQKNAFYNKIEKFSEDKNYIKLKGDYLEELLSKFKITRKDSEDYLYKISFDLGGIFNSRFSGTKEDIDYLIGYICSLCYYPSNPSIQLINRERALKIKELLRSRINNDVRTYIEENDSISKVDTYISKLHETFAQSALYPNLMSHIKDFELELKSHFTNGGNIYSILSRFIERTYSSSNINLSSDNSIDNLVKELLDLTFFFKLTCDGKISIDNEHDKLLLKVIGNQKFNFFNLVDTDDFESGKLKFTDIFKICNFSEKTQMFQDNLLNVIFSGKFDEEEFPNGHILELSFSDTPSSKDMESIGLGNEDIGDSIAKVTYKAMVINGSDSKVIDLFRKRTKLTDIQEYKNYVKSKLR
jgi:hypothetical protein